MEEEWGGLKEGDEWGGGVGQRVERKGREREEGVAPPFHL